MWVWFVCVYVTRVCVCVISMRVVLCVHVYVIMSAYVCDLCMCVVLCVHVYVIMSAYVCDLCMCVICACVYVHVWFVIVCVHGVCVRSLTRQPHMDDMFYNQQQQRLQYQQHLQDGSRLLTSVHNPATNTDLPPSSIGMSGNVDASAVYLFPTRLPPLDLTLVKKLQFWPRMKRSNVQVRWSKLQC